MTIEKSNAYQSALNLDNYLIEDDSSVLNRKTIIYFTSNGICPNDTEEEMEQQIIKKNFFEFYKTRLHGFQRHIFVRDVSKSFYLYGISNKVNSIEKLAQLLKSLALSDEIYCTGVSAGGNIAIILAALLGAKSIAFDVIPNLFDDEFLGYKPIIAARQDANLRPYMHLQEYLQRNPCKYKPIIFHSCQSKDDIIRMQNMHTLDCVKIFNIKYRHHGMQFSKVAIPFFTWDKLINIANNKAYHKEFFCLKLNIFLTLKICAVYVYKICRSYTNVSRIRKFIKIK